MTLTHLHKTKARVTLSHHSMRYYVHYLNDLVVVDRFCFRIERPQMIMMSSGLHILLLLIAFISGIFGKKFKY